MKVQWDFFSKRRNITLKEWVEHYKLKSVVDINKKMEELGLEPPSHLITEKVLKQISDESKPKPKTIKKVVKKPVVKKAQPARKATTQRKRKTTKK